MFNFSDNYENRKCYLKSNQVPTQTIMKNRMHALAPVYFKSMTPKLKILGGLEPSLKGGEGDWYMPPSEILKGRHVLKPIQKHYLQLLGFNGINLTETMIVKTHKQNLMKDKAQFLLENDMLWKRAIENSHRQQKKESTAEESKKNTKQILEVFEEFSKLYASSINKIENVIFEATAKEINDLREETYDRMKKRFRVMVDQQAKTLYNRFTRKLGKKKNGLKTLFLIKVQSNRAALGKRLHDINVEKHVAVEKLRHLFQCQKLACQLYIAMKEKEECRKEMDLLEHDHKKAMNIMKVTEQLKDIVIERVKKQAIGRETFLAIWKKKICQVVKKFQLFVRYCLREMPQHAEFFINMEKLMLLQVNEAVEDPEAESIIQQEDDDKFHTPIPRPHPFYLFREKAYKPDNLDQHLCPIHCTSSASIMPVVVMNKRCIYAACNNFEQYTQKIKKYIAGEVSQTDLEDDHDYKFSVPVKYTDHERLLELRLESSIMQVIQQEMPNVNRVPTECGDCKIPHCFCPTLKKPPLKKSQGKAKRTPNIMQEMQERLKNIQPMIMIPVIITSPSHSKAGHSRDKPIDHTTELEWEREPKLESYLKFVEPKRCKCPLAAKKHLEEHLPPYMRLMSKFETPELPNYEPCPLNVMKALVATTGMSPPRPVPPKAKPKRSNAATQYTDQLLYDIGSECVDVEDEITKIVTEIMKNAKRENSDHETKVIDNASASPPCLDQSVSEFAIQSMWSLRKLLDDKPELQELFKKDKCLY